MHKFKIYDQVIIADRGAQYTTPIETDTIALTHFKRGRNPTVIKGKETWKNYRIKGKIVKIIPEDYKYGVRLPDHGKHIVIGEYGLELADKRTDDHGFNNSSELHNTHILINNQIDRDNAIQFYKDRGYTWQMPSAHIQYGPACKYICVSDKHDYITYGLAFNGQCPPPTGSRDITHVIVRQGDPCTFLTSNIIPMTNTLEQLKFDKYVKVNQSKIVDLSDEIDNKLKIIANIADVCSELRCDALTTNQGMSKAFEICDRSALDSKFTKLKNYEKLFKSGTFDLFIKAFKDFDIAIDKIING